MTTHIFFLRHGRTALNASHKTRGGSDISLDDVGRKQAKAAGLKLQKEGGVDVIYSSPITRIYETAQIVADILGISKIKKDAGLDSLDYGFLEGKASDLTDKIVVDFITHRPFDKIGGDGESFQNFKKRYLDAFLDIINSNKGKRILIVSSSSGDRLLRAWLSSGAKTTYDVDIKTWKEEPIANGAYHHWNGIWSADAGLL